jgi:hypothetical protein
VSVRTISILLGRVAEEADTERCETNLCWLARECVSFLETR